MNKPAKVYGTGEWVVGAVILVFGVMGALMWFYFSKPALATSAVAVERPFDEVTASVICREAIRRTSKDPETAQVPMVASNQTEREIGFVWGPGTKLARMRNGLGLEVGVSAVCTTDRQTRKIHTLTVDGVKVI